jgi:hypothetical protein
MKYLLKSTNNYEDIIDSFEEIEGYCTCSTQEKIKIYVSDGSKIVIKFELKFSCWMEDEEIWIDQTQEGGVVVSNFETIQNVSVKIYLNELKDTNMLEKYKNNELKLFNEYVAPLLEEIPIQSNTVVNLALDEVIDNWLTIKKALM